MESKYTLIRLKTWELPYDVIDSVIKPLVKGEYELSVKTDKDGKPSAFSHSCLILADKEDVKTIMETELKSDATIIKKMGKPSISDGFNKFTIKTTAPMWVTESTFKDIFSKYNSDPGLYNIIIDGVKREKVSYPIVRLHPRFVDRNGERVKVNIAYIEFSAKYPDDAIIAQNMKYKTYLQNPSSPGEVISLIFKPWIENPAEASKIIKERREIYEEYCKKRTSLSGS